VIFRHGPAELRDPARWPDDRHRPLTDQGRRETRAAARGVRRLVGKVDRIASSGAVRARATADALRQLLDGSTAVETWAELGVGALADPIFARLRRAARSGRTIVLVGHAPALAEFLGLALAGEGVPFVKLGKGGAACVEFPAELRPGAGRLLWLLTRRQLADVRT
jgi:phosphohistidine phosphatase